MTAFATLADLADACRALPAADATAAAAVWARQDTLTKPPRSLGRLEALVAWLAAWQGRAAPRLEAVDVLVFAGSHGVARRGVSAFPPEVTAQMVANFDAGGAAINQLARLAGARLSVVALEVERPTGDFTRGPAMDEPAFLAAVAAGWNAVTPGLDLVCLGEMGIGNTTVAAALAAALFGGPAEDWVGPGTGVDADGLKRKAAAVRVGLARHADTVADPLAAAMRLGGRELAAMLGAALAARHHRIPLLLDGYVTTAAVAPLARLAPDGLAHAQAGHVSAEAGHRRLLGRLGLEPLLDLGMRLGEGSGACLAVPVVRGALACFSGMASFDEAGVAAKG
ncbi:nicotinate-nucleotide--dimethylbenzimidazole phosphoribosyltransferase [Aquibium sp. A9E412]|uniref:nicotinate-nucleotide--dimethylbenzimidazole phosphoribosyltransferase n=1 Tax=Aquibium sp. A9E412 TaxID=2976767 RepID=UPI0025B056B9|nr:nicotinate-nucleotide--dimethylbenzimidazole phosphoribosyltransferase [Aquibium sp. A9E412]MDN2565841.1 nicotinate-nucleotide--dimethylbenzimidazole phosphoribosyltransferase [Aquibium sp. A9E412]